MQSSCTTLNGNESIVTLSSDSEDELPSLSQRISLTRNTSSFKTCPVNGGVVKQAVGKGKEKQGSSSSSIEYSIVGDEVASASCVIRQPAVSKSYSSDNPIRSTADVMTTVHDDVSMLTRPTKGQTIGPSSNCNIISIHDDDPPTSLSQLSQSSPVALSSTNK